MDIANVAADEVFFHKYFSTMSKGKQQAQKKKEQRKRQLNEDSEAEEDEDEIWQALVKSRPELEGSNEGEESEPDGMASLDDYSDTASSIDGLDQPLASDDAQQLEDLDLEDEHDALISSDDEVPDNLDQSFAEEVEFGKKSEEPNLGVNEQRRNKRLKVKNLPTFASAEDYAKMLEEES